LNSLLATAPIPSCDNCRSMAGGKYRKGSDRNRLLLQGCAEHRLRDTDLRLHDRRRDVIPARQQHRGRMTGGPARARSLGKGRWRKAADLSSEEFGASRRIGVGNSS
jgi:hypothetical protein